MSTPAKEDETERLRALHGTLASLAEETRLRLAEIMDEMAALRDSLQGVEQRVAGLESQQGGLAKDVARIAGVLDEESAGVLNHIRADLETLHGELVETRARVSESELSVLDAFLGAGGENDGERKRTARTGSDG